MRGARRSRAGTAGALALATLGLTVAGYAAAPAAVAAGTYNGPCGPGYKVVDALPLGDATTVFLTWNGSTGKNCVVHQIVTDNGGWPWMVGVWIQRTADGTMARDYGAYTRYAGPRYVNGRGTCISWGGWLGSDPSEHAVARYDSHCG
ncbi:spore-associated protein A [Streptomyces sp. NPDC093225]|uniref:spore-associated protein A n=1 Tax=Streptomyces sp. NPDC093225 TaxID=3366034 RepID=UPI00382C36B8